MSQSSDIVLVTGASGFLGSHLLQYLSAKGDHVRALYYSTPPREGASIPNVEWQQCDLLDIYAVEDVMLNVKEVYHCAAIVSFSKKDRLKLLQVNIDSTANVVNAANDAGVRKFVYVSSIAALGRSKENVPISEAEQWEESRQNSIYSESKYYAEMEVWRGMAEGLNAVIINPGIILGEGDWEKGSAQLVDIVYSEFPYYTMGTNAWVDVKDVCRVMYALMHSNISEERFIVSAGNFAYKDIFTKLANAMNRKPPHKKASRWMSALVWRLSAIKSLFTGKPAGITKETARTAQQQVAYDNTKLLNMLEGFKYTTIDDTLSRIGQAYLAEKVVKS